MPMQHHAGIDAGSSAAARYPATSRTTGLNPDLLHERRDPFAFFAQLHLPPGTQLQHRATNDGTRLVAPDGSWSETSNQPDPSGRHHVTEAGPQRLWHIIENAHRLFIALGNPSWSRFGITATPHQQSVWLDYPENRSWPIPTTTGAP